MGADQILLSMFLYIFQYIHENAVQLRIESVENYYPVERYVFKIIGRAWFSEFKQIAGKPIVIHI